MRKTIWVPALLMALTVPARALASAGLPQLARIDVGSYQAQLLGDSPQLHTGTNTITVAVPGLSPEDEISLAFLGPQGQSVQVPLRTLVVLDGPDGGHGESGHAESPAAGSHEEADAGDHGQTDAHGHAGEDHHSDDDGHMAESAHTEDPGQPEDHTSQVSHGEEASEPGHGDDGHDDSAYQVRGKAVLPETGTWTAVLTIDGATEEFPFAVVPGGPNRLFVGFSGSVMGAALLFGVVGRRRRQNKEG